MLNTTNNRIVLLALLTTIFWMSCSFAQDLPKPLPPPKTIPEFDYENAQAICVNCGEPFDFPSHEEANAAILKSPYVKQLRSAMYWQDTVHQFESKAHFDNCDFDGSFGYINALWSEVNAEVQGAQLDDKQDVEDRVERAFLALGQILHAVQDFYAHTNYVEMNVGRVQNVTDLPVLRPWTSHGQEHIEELQQRGLISGYVFWGFPQKCPADTLTHGELAKDSGKTDSGKVRIPHLENLSQHRIALFLAREASKNLLEAAFQQWPLLEKTNGPYVGFEMLIDRRGL